VDERPSSNETDTQRESSRRLLHSETAKATSPSSAPSPLAELAGAFCSSRARVVSRVLLARTAAVAESLSKDPYDSQFYDSLALAFNR